MLNEIVEHYFVKLLRPVVQDKLVLEWAALSATFSSIALYTAIRGDPPAAYLTFLATGCGLGAAAYVLYRYNKRNRNT